MQGAWREYAWNMSRRCIGYIYIYRERERERENT
jgi:hypothetical protein